MTDQHPITTPDKQLVRKWIEDWAGGQMKGPVTEDQLVVATQAAQWGGDQELEACCEWLEKDLDAYELVGLRAVYLDHNLHAARRPRPPSRKEQALEAISRLCASVIHDDLKDDAAIVRRALEALDD